MIKALAIFSLLLMAVLAKGKYDYSERTSDD